MAPTLSLIIPAYDEATRLPAYLAQIRPYLDTTFAGHYEVIVVDDGSQDDLPNFLEHASAAWPQLSFVRHLHNSGKGSAVRTGMQLACGELLLFADADGATPIQEEARLRAAIHAGAAVAVGSRLLSAPHARVCRPWHRRLVGRAFALLVRQLFRLRVLDTQCGFKMFRREAELRIVPLCRQSGFLFDIEVLVLACRLGYLIREVPVAWHDVRGSKVRLVRDSYRMFTGLWHLRNSLVDSPSASYPFGQQGIVSRVEIAHSDSTAIN